MKYLHPEACVVLDLVATLYGVEASRLWGTERTPTLVEARHLAWWQLQRVTGWSYNELGAALGMHHTSVMSGVGRTKRRCSQTLSSTPRFARALNMLTAVTAEAAE